MSHSKNSDNHELEKAKWVEEQVNRTLAFRFESSEIIRKEAHATLGWLYTIAVGATGIVSTHPAKDQLWLTIPLGAAAISAGVEAWLLIRGALMATTYPSPGNIPSNIATPKNLQLSEAEMRLSEARGIEETVTELEKLNRRKAESLNHARQAVAIIPAATLLTIMATFAFFS